jgi:hypothetical protein
MEIASRCHSQYLLLQTDNKLSCGYTLLKLVEPALLKRLWEVVFIHSFANLGVLNGNGEDYNNCQLCNSGGLCLSEAITSESWIE